VSSVAPKVSEPSGESERRALAGRAGIVGAGTLVSRLLGLARDQTLAALFSRGETPQRRRCYKKLPFWLAFDSPTATGRDAPVGIFPDVCGYRTYIELALKERRSLETVPSPELAR